MNSRQIGSSLLGMALLCTVWHADAATKKKAKTYMKLVAAYNQTREQDAAAPPETGDHIVVVWQGASYPETFFWRGENGWLNCKVEKAHKTMHKSGKTTKTDYTTEPLSNGDVHKGDTILLSPVTRGRFPIPAEIPATAKNTLFFKTGGSVWLSFKVKTITKATSTTQR